MIVRQLILVAAIAAGAAQAQKLPGASRSVEEATPGQPPAKAPAARGAGPSYKDLKYAPLRPMALPQIGRFQLPNGMKLMLLEDHETPMVTGQAIVRTGSVFDPADRSGLAMLTGLLIRGGGSRLKTPNQVDYDLENLGATIDSSISESMGTISFTALKENLAPSLVLFRDMLTSPDFRLDRIDRAKIGIQNGIAHRNNDARGALHREFRAIVDGKDSPYDRRIEYATLGRITRADIDGFYRRYFFPANITLAIYGDFDTTEMKGAILSLFSDWKTEQPPVPEFPKAVASNAAGAFLAVKPDLRETHFAAGQPVADLNDKDNAPLDVLATILGATPQSRLNQRGRIGMAGVRDIRAEWLAGYGNAGMFVVSGSNESSATGDTVKAITEEIQRLRATEVTDDELRLAKEAALIQLTAGLDNKYLQLVGIATHEYYNGGPDYYTEYQKALAGVTRADVLRVAKERLNPDQFTVAAISNMSVFTKPLDGKGGTPTRIDLTIPPPRQAEAAKSDTATLELGKQLLRRAQQASGGVEKLAAVKDMTVTTAFTLAEGGKANETDRWISTSYFREEGTSPRIGTIIRYSDGKNGWVSNGRASAPLVGAGLKQTLSDLLRIHISLLLSDRIPGRVVNALDDRTLEITQGELITRIVLDPATGLPAKVLYETVSDKGLPIYYQDDLSDYREVDGIKLPFATHTIQNGASYNDGVVSEYKLNQGLKPEVLQRRP